MALPIETVASGMSFVFMLPIVAIAPVVGAAAIGGVTALLGGHKNAKASKQAGSTQERMAREALAEQKRIYDLEDAKEKERYQQSRQDLEYDRTKTRQDEERVRGSRQNAFGGFSADLSGFSKGYAPAYGMSAEQTQGLMDQRNSGISYGGGYVPPSMGDKGMGPGPDPMAPRMPTPVPGGQTGPALPGPSQPGSMGGSMTSSVWLQAPTGETMQFPLSDAAGITEMIKQGAVLIPAPTGGQ